MPLSSMHAYPHCKHEGQMKIVDLLQTPAATAKATIGLDACMDVCPCMLQAILTACFTPWGLAPNVHAVGSCLTHRLGQRAQC